VVWLVLKVEVSGSRSDIYLFIIRYKHTLRHSL